MTRIFIFIVLLVLVACTGTSDRSTNFSPSVEIQDSSIPTILIDESALYYNKQTSEWYFNDVLFSGYGVAHYDDGKKKLKFGVLNGKKQGAYLEWYQDGHNKTISNYHLGKLHGEKKRWANNAEHTLIAQLNYVQNRGHGQQIQWYATGEVFKVMNLNMGREEGMQRAYRKNGDLYANYQAKNGRIFGLKKSALCFGLDEENIQNRG